MTSAPQDTWRIDKSEYLAAIGEVVAGERGPVAEVTLLHTWGPTVVAAVRPAEGAEVVVKASARQDIHAEARACRLAREAGLAAPRVLARGEHDGLPGRRWYLMTRLPGTRWSQLRLDPDRQALVLDQLADNLARLHAVRRSGFGPVTEHGHGAVDSWEDWLRTGFAAGLDHVSAALAAAARLRGLVSAALAALSDRLSRRPGALLHADLGDDEIFVDPDSARITGLADWGAAIIGDPLYEFARFVAGGPVDDPRVPRLLPVLREAYGSRTGIDWAAHQPLIDLYEAHNAIDNAAWALREGVDWADSLCRKADSLLQRAAAG